uniref:H15 domain-containing protein n=1 Tax=Ciona savignyi TaxID=51511 RepID=H2Z7K7_CIOSA
MKELKSKKKPAYIDMIVEAIIKIDDKPGASVKAITTSIVQMYSLNTDKIKKYVKHALEKGLTDEILIRPKKAGHAEPKGVLTGRYKVNPTYLKKNKAANKKKQVKKKTAPKEKKEKLPSAKSLKEKPYSVQLAKDKLKQARMSLNISPSPMAVKHRKRKMAEKISSTAKNTTKPPSASPTKKKIREKGQNKSFY